MKSPIYHAAVFFMVFSSANGAMAQKATEGPTDPIVTWNLITIKATKTAGLNSNLSTRIEAIEAIAVYDAVNSIKHIGTPYHYYVPVKGKASVQAAVAYAAHAVLVNYFPGQKTDLDAALETSLKSVGDGAIGKAEYVGTASAADIIALRTNDGSSLISTYPGPQQLAAGAYRPTPAKFAPGIDVEWGKLRPFIIPDSKIFLPPPHPH